MINISTTVKINNLTLQRLSALSSVFLSLINPAKINHIKPGISKTRPTARPLMAIARLRLWARFIHIPHATGAKNPNNIILGLLKRAACKNQLLDAKTTLPLAA